MDNKRRPILYKGEVYTTPVEKKVGGPIREPEVTYEAARNNVITSLNSVVSNIKELPTEARLPNEYIVCLRLQSEFSAKSYYPGSLFEYDNTKEFAEIGSRQWKEKKDHSEDKTVDEKGKLFFVRTTEKGLNNLQQKLENSESQLTKEFTIDIRKIKSIDLLSVPEQILAIEDEWKEGRLEAVLHPFELDQNLLKDHFISKLKNIGVNIETIRLKQYESGITFVSLFGNRETVKQLGNYNPLRMLHPLEARSIPVLRGTTEIGGPLAPDFTSKSSIVVGMFDGGIPEKNPFLKNYAESSDLVPSRPDQTGIAHGNAVAGVILYGPLNKYANGEKLPEPNISVKSFRVLPTTNPADIDLYEVIDGIEDVVPKEKDIRVYNLSIGPRGEILDDPVSRFTYALDLLTVKYGILFSSAVGNDGEKSKNRVQSPSDIVHGLGVAAYTKREGKIIRAPYSCIGPGREGNKLKPDLAAFGGCEHTPIHLLSLDPRSKLLSPGGTSFASPIVAGLAGQLVGRSQGAMGIIAARAALIHSSKNGNKHDHHLGHGIIPDEIEEIVSCGNNSYTLIYQGEILPGKYAELKIPWMNDISIPGNVLFHWTVVAVPGIDPSHSDDYTEGAILTTFYPNANKYQYVLKENNRKKTAVVDIRLQPDLARSLEQQGWEKGNFPKSEVGPTPFANEQELRRNMKWDTVENSFKNKRSALDVSNPMFHLHALGRGNGDKNKKIKYALVLTVETPKSNVDLYAGVLQRYDALASLKLLSRNEIRIR